MQDTFQWTDELVQEFVQFTLHQSPAFQGRYTDMEQFKSSKSPKKEWEIVAFRERCGIGIYKLREDGKYRNDDFLYVQGLSLNAMLEDGDVIISVRRLSDGEVWSPDDKYKLSNDSRVRTIKGFSLSDDRSVLRIHTEDGYMIADAPYWNGMKKLPQPILTTVDGFELFEDRGVIVVYLKDHSYSIGPLSGFHPDVLDNNKVFVYDYNAQQYIFENKPLLSLNDVRDKLSEWVAPGLVKFVIGSLTALVKQKLNDKNL